MRFFHSPEPALHIGNSEVIRTLSAFEIMLGHIGLATGSLLLYPNRKAGILFVGLFFMLSGYGLAYGFDRKENYLHGFLKRRIPTLLLPAIPVLLITCILAGTYSFPTISDGPRWYIWEQLGFYILFFAIYSLCKKRPALYISVIAAVFIVIAHYFGMDNPWYGSTMCFPLGILYYSKTKGGTEAAFQRYRILTATVLAICVAGSIATFFLYQNTFAGDVVARNIASSAFCLLVCLLFERLTIENRVMKRLSGISYEIYLIHPVVIEVLKRYELDKQALYFSILTLLITIPAACIFGILSHRIRRMLAGMKA